MTDFRPNVINHRDAAEYMAAFEDMTKIYFDTEGDKEAKQLAVKAEVARRQKATTDRSASYDREWRPDELAYYRGLEAGLIFAYETVRWTAPSFRLNELKPEDANLK